MRIWLFVRELRVCMTSQHDPPLKVLASQVVIQVGHCLLTGSYFKPWSLLFLGHCP